MSTRTILEIFGWIGSGLIVLSLAQARVYRFRVLNFAGAALGTMYNALLGIWPFAAMNGVIAVIDVYWIWRLTRERHDEQAYEVGEVGIDDLGEVLGLDNGSGAVEFDHDAQRQLGDVSA